MQAAPTPHALETVEKVAVTHIKYMFLIDNFKYSCIFICNRKETIMSMKQAYVEKVQARLNEWDAEIEKLKARADEAEADAKISYHKQIETLREEQRQAQAKLDELRAAGDDAWEYMKAGVQNAWDSLEQAAKDARSRFAA
jgi:chromosome segregation ATPase